LSGNTDTVKPKQIKRISDADIKSGETLYYGLDGDDTGSILEELFLSSSDEIKFKKLSKSIALAISKVSSFISSKSKNSIVFEAGDDLLFKGYFNEDTLKYMQKMYYDTTSGLTCSIGYGRSFQEVYLALKLAKTQPGKNSIVGIDLK
jgi:hypothetical protein